MFFTQFPDKTSKMSQLGQWYWPHVIHNLPSQGSPQLCPTPPHFFCHTYLHVYPSLSGTHSSLHEVLNCGIFALLTTDLLKEAKAWYGNLWGWLFALSTTLLRVWVLVACAFPGWAVFHGMETSPSAESWPTEGCLLLLAVPSSVAGGVHVQVLGEG